MTPEGESELVRAVTFAKPTGLKDVHCNGGTCVFKLLGPTVFDAMICENCTPILEGPQALDHEACGSWVLSLEEAAVVNSSWEGRVLMLDKSVSMLRLDEGLEVSALRDCFASFCSVMGLLVLTDSFKESFAVWVLIAFTEGVA